jgi:hypothetical protein
MKLCYGFGLEVLIPMVSSWLCSVSWFMLFTPRSWFKNGGRVGGSQMTGEGLGHWFITGLGTHGLPRLQGHTP